ncbi:heavy metal translocating P-type ATPase [Desulfovibrio subterraneus]|uniref:heavy metal translocating P-type ATPase n=1 Tax=Desulfovibrio subterraneus TaxID=2718620 RepID=UPI0022B8B629|nr:heavy metal translocating P-type ATPase [Desulfovibrio subterraneus]WBF67201.1 heavy metal translocating P-type ATPase [Desulfovibrio subterraneus]
MIIVRSIPGRVRFSAASAEVMPLLQARLHEAVRDMQVEIAFVFNPRTGRGLLTFVQDDELTRVVLIAVEEVAEQLTQPALPPCRHAESGDPAACTLPMLGSNVVETEKLDSPFLIIARKVGRFYLTKLLMPPWLRPYWTLFSVMPLLLEGVKSLLRGKLNVSVLDAAAIGASIAMRDFNTAGTVHLLLDISETLEDWTREKSRADLAALYRGDSKPVWVMRGSGPVSIPSGELVAGDMVIVRSGSRIPVDGVVADGMAMVNQSSMTGEPMPVKKSVGAEVFAGTVVDEGNIIILSEGVGDETRFAKIARIISESEGLKADIHGQAVRLADKIVPFSFILSGLVFLFTRNWMKAASVLLADYSCAIKLATPLAVRSAMLEAAHRGAVIKGGRHIEALARMDAIVLDKTGTLTEARPVVMDICPVNGFSREFVLRNAACMEEHFPHPVAEAIVRKAEEEGLHHEEDHAEVEYILAHGISTTLHGERMILGSRHFVHEDEGIEIDEAATYIQRCTDSGLSLLYFGVGGRLAGVIALEDPLRPSAHRFIRRLENAGMERIIMLTGDGQGTAQAVAEELEITEYYAQALPDQKTDLIDRLREEGYVVAMVGDGINDSAALTRADVGVSMKHGADIAREACDVMITSDRLDSLMDSIAISRKTMRRVRRNFMFIVVSNTIFIGLGLTGLISPAMLALLHNSGTVLTCAHSMRPVLSGN